MSRIVSLLVSIFVSILTINVYGVGTPAGTIIQNQATISYDIGGLTQSATAIQNIQVAEIIDVNVVSLDPSDVQVGTPMNNVVLAYTVTNIGNGNEVFDLVAADQTGDDITIPSFDIYLEEGTTPGFQQVEDTLYTGSNFSSLSPDSARDVYVVFDVPGGLADGNQGFVDFTVSSNTAGAAGSAAGTLLVGVGDSGVDALVGLSTAEQLITKRLLVAAVSVVFNKTVASVTDPFSGATQTPVPGAEITYQLEVIVSGTGTVTNIIVNDPLVTELDYVTNSIVLDSVAKTDVSDADEAEFDSANQEVIVDLGTLTAPSTRIIEFKATIK